MLRNLMLFLASNAKLAALISQVGRRSGLTRRFIAGESLAEAIPAIRELESLGLDTTLDLLGEGVTQEEEAVNAARLYRRLLRRIEETQLRSGISIKLTQLGLGFDRELCDRNLRLILDEAESLKKFVRIDMESSAYTEATLDLFRTQLEHYGPRRVGVVVQSYLYRTESDVKSLIGTGCNIRLCKGAYMEPEEVAFPKKADVDANFTRLLDLMLDSDLYSAIATHDERMIAHAKKVIASNGLPENRYEFQMLFGVRRELQVALRQEGFRMRVYVPFGTQWAPYFMRRLAERPANVLFILRNMFKA
ncbi:MAG: proline dehydrogenase family protein [Acidobacteriota bacterium]|nr:MAG: proline dehydrogenase family protein [Acidobacteriota bacterium]